MTTLRLSTAKEERDSNPRRLTIDLLTHTASLSLITSQNHIMNLLKVPQVPLALEMMNSELYQDNNSNKPGLGPGPMHPVVLDLEVDLVMVNSGDLQDHSNSQNLAHQGLDLRAILKGQSLKDRLGNKSRNLRVKS